MVNVEVIGEFQGKRLEILNEINKPKRGSRCGSVEEQLVAQNLQGPGFNSLALQKTKK